MNKKRILLCCGAGMSSGFIATETIKAAMAEGYDWDITAKSQSQAIDEFPDYDVCLLGPHFESNLEEFLEAAEVEGAETVIGVIPKDVYGQINGKALVNYIKKIIDEK